MGSEAIAITAIEHHGATVRLIGAMIATIAFCCLDDQTFIDTASCFIDAVESKLPYAISAIEILRTILEEPDPSRIGEALSTLPFNYH